MYVLGARQLELREEAWGGKGWRNQTVFVFFQLEWKIWDGLFLKIGIPTVPPPNLTEQKKSDYLTQATHFSSELICLLYPLRLLPFLPPFLRLSGPTPLGWSSSWARLGSRLDADTPWWMLKDLTLWLMSQRANNTASEVLCQVEYWFHVPCTLDTTTTTDSKLHHRHPPFVCLTLEEIQ